jgi:formamidopyrimidine-DNA glycosylase
MPELPEVESARTVLEEHALHRRITAIDEVDTYVCRPFSTQDFRSALLHIEFTAAQRQGKALRLTTNGRADVGLHLGMGGRLVVTDATGAVVDGGDSAHGRAGAHQTRWDRFVIHFNDGALRLTDRRRFGRAVLDPNHAVLGLDAMAITLAEFRAALGPSTSPIKARLLNQSVVAGIGNLLADETLWRARIAPGRPTKSLNAAETATLHRCMRAAVRYTTQHGGSHTGHIVPYRHQDARCPRCGAEMARARIGGRSTWWCPVEQT